MSDTYLTWCKELFTSLADGGVWYSPRSGLAFTRRGNELAFTSRGQQIGLTERQVDLELDTIRRNFAAAGITVT